MKKITNPSDTVLIDPNEPLILPDGTTLVGRIEWFLYALCCLDYQNLPTPMSRIEEFANALITGEIPNIEPQSRAEQFFLAILDGNVSNLPQPQSRSEVLLDKLARGEFDLSDVEPIQSHYELLLAYLIKNGGIDNIDYVLYEFSEAMKTMYNTVEKPFKSLELSGNTLVNCVLEDTENDDYTSFDKDYNGTSFTINGTSEGAIKSAILSGNTLVNLLDISKLPKNNITLQNNVISYDGVNITELINLKNLEPSTKYALFFNVIKESESPDIPLRVNDTGLNYDINLYGETKPSSGFHSFTTGENVSNVVFTIYTNGRNKGYKISTPMIIKYQDGMENWSIPYFEGMQSVKMPVLKTTGKNLFDGKIELGGIYSNGNDAGNNQGGITDRVRSINYIPVNPNTTYILSDNESNVINANFYEYDENKTFIYSTASVSSVNTNSSTRYIRFINRNTDTNVKYQLEEGSVATPYEPYKTNILTTSEEVVLRSLPNGVCDTLNVETGEITQRIGEVVLDGSKGVAWQEGSIRAFYIRENRLKRLQNYSQAIISDIGSVVAHYGSFVDGCNEVQITGYLDTQNKYPNENWFYIRVPNIESDVNTLKQYLSQNPITIQYELATPVIKTVALNVVDQNNTKIDKMHVFNEVTHVNATSDELTPTVNIGKSVLYPTIIKPNTKYTVDLKRNDKPLTVNLGGTEVTFTSGETRKTITTPSTLTNDKLSCYGIGAKCNEIMLIEGEVEGNVDYFTGMQSVVMQNQMPILSTVGKNLFDKNTMKTSWWVDVDGVRKDDGNTAYSIIVPITENKIYTVSLKNSNRANYAFLDKDYNTLLIKTGNKQTDASPIGSRYLLYYLNNTDLELCSDIQLEEGSTATPYEPYKTSILSYNEEVVLRGIDDVQDTLDCLTGEVTERIGEIVLNGSEYWTYSGDHVSNEEYAVYNTKITTPINSLNIGIADKLRYDREAISQTVFTKECVYINSAYQVCYVRIKRERGNIANYLNSNPITIQYQLATESIKTVDLNVVDQNGNTIPKVKSYNGTTHLEVTIPKQSLLPNISAEVATDNSKDMSSLTVKHQEISEAQSAIQNSIQSQSDEIDTAMMATTEIFESILE